MNICKLMIVQSLKNSVLESGWMSVVVAYIWLVLLLLELSRVIWFSLTKLWYLKWRWDHIYKLNSFIYISSLTYKTILSISRMFADMLHFRRCCKLRVSRKSFLELKLLKKVNLVLCWCLVFAVKMMFLVEALQWWVARIKLSCLLSTSNAWG